MQNNKKQTLFDFFNSKQTQALIAIAGLLIAAFNVLIAARITPLANNISIVQGAVAKLELADQEFVPRTEIDSSIVDRLDRIENKLDRLLEQ